MLPATVINPSLPEGAEVPMPILPPEKYINSFTELHGYAELPRLNELLSVGDTSPETCSVP